MMLRRLPDIAERHENPMLARWQSAVVIAGTVLAAAFLLFYRIDGEPLHRWDEPLYARVAFNIAYHGTPLEGYENFNGEGYFQRETKPRLVFSFQALMMRLFGYDRNIAIRLHSVLAAGLLVLFLLRICARRFGSPLLGVFSALVLLSTRGFMHHHMARSGDLDSLLVLFTTLGAWFFFEYVRRMEEDRNDPNILLSALFFALAVLTKSVAGLLFLPGLLLYILYRRKLALMLGSRSFYLAVLLVTVIVGAYYLYEEIHNPGFLRAVWDLEIFGRYTTVIHRNARPFHFYLKYLFFSPYHAPWIFFVPLSLLLLFRGENGPLKEFVRFSLIVAATFFLVISLSRTKITWYVGPLYGFLAVLSGIGLLSLFRAAVAAFGPSGTTSRFVLLGAFMAAFFTLPVHTVLNDITEYENPRFDRGYEYAIHHEGLRYIRDKGLGEYRNLTVFRHPKDPHADWSPQLAFYRDVYTTAYGFSIVVSKDPEELGAGDTVLASWPAYGDYLQERFVHTVIREFGKTILIRIE